MIGAVLIYILCMLVPASPICYGVLGQLTAADCSAWLWTMWHVLGGIVDNQDSPFLQPFPAALSCRLVDSVTEPRNM